MHEQFPCQRAYRRYMVYGKEKVFDADRLIDLLNAFESFTVAAGSARGDMDNVPQPAASTSGNWQQGGGGWLGSNNGGGGPGAWPTPLGGLLAAPFALLAPNSGGPAAGWPFAGADASAGGGSVGQPGSTQQQGAVPGGSIGLFGLPPNRFDVRQGDGTLDSQGRLREALRFVFSQVRTNCRGLSVSVPEYAFRHRLCPTLPSKSHIIDICSHQHRRARSSGRSSWTRWSSPSTRCPASSSRCLWSASASAALACPCFFRAPQSAASRWRRTCPTRTGR